MAYIGVKPTIGNFQICDAISVVNGQAAYTMQVGAVNVIPQSANHMIVSLNGVTQAPGPNGGFTIQGTNIVFDSALTSSDVIDYIVVMGNSLSAGVPSTGSVQGPHLSSNLFRDPLRINNATISSDITIASGERAMVAGDISIANSITLTVNGVLTVV